MNRPPSVRLSDCCCTLVVVEFESWNGLRRSSCPKCGSGDVEVLCIGDYMVGEWMNDKPDWVRMVGCLHPGYDRECLACGNQWEQDEP